jgi:hypothetical protein
VLHGRTTIPVTAETFDVLCVEGRETRFACHMRSGVRCEALELNGPAWRTPDVFDDGEALREATGGRGVERS